MIAAACSGETLETAAQQEAAADTGAIAETSNEGSADSEVATTTTADPEAASPTTLPETTVPETTVPETTTPETTTVLETTTAPQSATLCSGGSGEPGLEVALFWSDGEERSYEIVIAEDDPRPGRGGSSTTPYTVTANTDANGLLVYEMTAGETELDGALDPVTAQILSESPREHLVYTFNPLQGTIDVQNIDELRANIIEATSLLSSLDSESGAESFQQIIEVYNSLPDNEIAAIFSERAQALHHFDGTVLYDGDQLQGADVLPNPFGGEPFTGISTITHMPELDAEGCEVVEINTVLDPENAARVLSDTLGTTFDIDAPDFDAIIAIENTVTLQFDNGTNRVRRVSAVQELTVEGLMASESLIITDVTGN